MKLKFWHPDLKTHVKMHVGTTLIFFRESYFVSEKTQFHIFIDFNITKYRHREEEFFPLFEQEDGLTFCANVEQLFALFKYPYEANEWRIFIDSSKSGLKAVLLHNGNRQPSVPIAYSKTMDETYDNMKILLQKIKYWDHNWRICCDLKVVRLLMGMQGGRAKNPCYLCLWDSYKRDLHYTNHVWAKRDKFVLNENNVIHDKLVDPKNIILPALHIKLGIMTQFVKTLNGKPIERLKKLLPWISSSKIEAGVFNGPEIDKILEDSINSFTRKPKRPR